MLQRIEQGTKYSKSGLVPLPLSEWLSPISLSSHNAPDNSNVLESGGHLE